MHIKSSNVTISVAIGKGLNDRVNYYGEKKKSKIKLSGGLFFENAREKNKPNLETWSSNLKVSTYFRNFSHISLEFFQRALSDLIFFILVTCNMSSSCWGAPRDNRELICDVFEPRTSTGS